MKCHDRVDLHSLLVSIARCLHEVTNGEHIFGRKSQSEAPFVRVSHFKICSFNLETFGTENLHI
jgi:hypothetical protein